MKAIDNVATTVRDDTAQVIQKGSSSLLQHHAFAFKLKRYTSAIAIQYDFLLTLVFLLILNQHMI